MKTILPINFTMENNVTEVATKLTYEQFTNVTQSLPFLIILGFIWVGIGLILYLIIAGNRRAKTSSGTKLKSSMLSHGNAWIPIIIWLIQGIFIFLGIIFPIWLRIFK